MLCVRLCICVYAADHMMYTVRHYVVCVIVPLSMIENTHEFYVTSDRRMNAHNSTVTARKISQKTLCTIMCTDPTSGLGSQ